MKKNCETNREKNCVTVKILTKSLTKKKYIMIHFGRFLMLIIYESEGVRMLRSKVGFCRLLPIVPVVLFAGFSAFAEDTTSVPEVVWVKADKAAFESEGVIGDGTEANPFNTIQKGVDTVAVGGTVKIMAGTYDYDEQFDGTHTNRVIINKRVILDGVDGMDVTHIVGKLAEVKLNESPYKLGNGLDAIRCVKVLNTDANSSIIKNVTIRNGGAGAQTSGTLDGFGGGVCGASISSRSSFFLVDCVVSNCAAGMGGGLNGVSAVRCRISDCRSSGYGAAVRYGNLMHCLLVKSRKYNITVSETRPVVANSYAVNCTLENGDEVGTSGFGYNSYVYNCVVYQTKGNAIQSDVKAAENCYAGDNLANPFVDIDRGDYRLTVGTAAIGSGLVGHWSKITLPDGVAADIDLAGNNIDSAKGVCDIGCYQRVLHWYVDAKNGDDGNSGCKADAAKKTLAAIMSETLPGDTVYAASGTYNENAAVTPLGGKARVVVPQGVTLIAEDEAGNTFIVGAPDETESGDEYGFGTNAVRCVYLSENSRIDGFIITGGYTWGENLPAGMGAGNKNGAGIYGADRATTFVDNCVISNNWTYQHGGGINSVTAMRSLIVENHSLNQGGAMHLSNIYGCVVDKNCSGGTKNWSACYKPCEIIGCVLGENNYVIDGSKGGVSITAESDNAKIMYNIILGGLGTWKYAATKFIGCVFKSVSSSWKDKCDETCVRYAGDAIKLDENYRPLPDSIGVDWVTAEQLSSATGGKLPVDKDLSGFQRVMNGKVDVGALEADWCGEYAKLLDGSGKRIVVESAAPGIVTNDVSGIMSLSLHNGETLEFVWWSDMPKAKRKGTVSVTGDGTLTLKRNGVEYAAFDSSFSPVEFSIPVDGNEDCRFEFAFAGEGFADIYSLSSTKGLALSIR